MGVNKFLKTGSIVYLIFAVIQIIPAVQEFKYANAAGVQSQSTAHMISMYCCLISMAVGILLGVCGLTGKALGLCKIIDTVFIAAAVLSFLQGIVLNSFGTLVFWIDLLNLAVAIIYLVGINKENGYFR